MTGDNNIMWCGGRILLILSGYNTYNVPFVVSAPAPSEHLLLLFTLQKIYIYISKNDKENSKNQTKRKGKDFSMFESLSVPLLRVIKLLVAFAFRKGTFRYHFDSRCCFSHFSMSLSRFLLLPPACFFLLIRRKEPPLFLMHAWSSAYIGVKIPSSLAVKPAMCVWTLDPRYS